ncbi:Gal-2,6-Sulfurylases II [Chondrus crispus]|uniref:Gal-2,6-Sulfurylases II n=1 Tax=Chondrus crispus TaxID=2769 RepID=R7QS37_CHOCR|nr:Gal-2,6-Sulfurylases II [Chondrus crispus]CDF41302.1 Gal-2,6-Sulfurylases II [Chondrus crispus]|eukprot:XP_005711596.1 Gal-2,6-Sulfurylases II [Chondrus crispus]
MNASFLFVLLLSALAFTANAQCRNLCRFRFCRLDGSMRPNNARSILRGPDYSRTGFICRNFPGGRTLGRIRSTGTALIQSGSTITPINKFRPNGLSPAFPRNYFRVTPLTFQRNRQGVARRASVGNQEDFLDDLCVRLPIRNYNIDNTDGSVFRTIATSDPRDCIAFRPVVRPIVVDVAWDSSDDFDLSVEGPPGSLGGRVNDNLVAACGLFPAGKEAVSFENMVPGKYTVKLMHFNNCFNKRTRWVVNVVVNGVTIQRRLGRSNVDDRTVLELEFTV